MNALFQPARAPRGFSLVEILVALALLAVALTTVTVLFVGHHRVQIRIAQQWAAQSYLNERLEALQASFPLEEGTRVLKLGDEIEAPAGMPWEGGTLELSVKPWEEVRRDERTQHVVLTLRWDWHGEVRTSRIETLLGGAVP